jgi:hypothetical protein
LPAYRHFNQGAFKIRQKPPFLIVKRRKNPGSVEIVQDMVVKTLLGVFAVPEGKGKLEKI